MDTRDECCAKPQQCIAGTQQPHPNTTARKCSYDHAIHNEGGAFQWPPQVIRSGEYTIINELYTK